MLDIGDIKIYTLPQAASDVKNRSSVQVMEVGVSYVVFKNSSPKWRLVWQNNIHFEQLLAI